MIKLAVDEKDVSGLIKGNLLSLCAETIMLVEYIYASIRENDKGIAKEYKNMISRAFNSGMVFNCCDDDEDEDDDEEENAGYGLNYIFGDALESMERLTNE